MRKSVLLAVFGLFFFHQNFAQKPGYVPGEVIVQLAPHASERALEMELQQLDGAQTRLSVKKELSLPLRIWLLDFDNQKIKEDRMLEALRQMPTVEVAQFNHYIEMRDTTPDDVNFTDQWYWRNVGQMGGTPDADVDADLAWDLTTGGGTLSGEKIVVCVLEGCNRNHPDLQSNLWFNINEIPNNGIDDDNNGYIDDVEGWNVSTETDFVNPEAHGTAVSGVIGAKGNNGQLLAGLNWDVKIMNVDFSSPTESEVIAAYTYPLVQRRIYNESAGTKGSLVVATNASWGIDGADPADFPLWCSFYDTLGAAGILNIVSTSNENVNVDVVGDMPSGCSSEYLISVTATDDHDQRNFSAYGETTVDLAAPGEEVVLLNLNGGPVFDSGTSYAAPMVSGAVALLYSASCPSLGLRAYADPPGTAEMMRDAIFDGVEVKPNLVDETLTGGRLNVFNSLNLLLDNCSRCEEPFGLGAIDFDDVSGALIWTSTDSTLNSTLRWRKLGEPIWNEAENAESPLPVTGLEACTEYEFQVQDICVDTVSGFTESYIFTTDGCCEAPDNLLVTDILATSATISWESVLAAESYNLYLHSQAGTVFVPNLPFTTFLANALEPCTEYEVQVEVVCEGGVTDLSTSVSWLTLGCGTCIDSEYCLSYSENSDEEWIANVTLNTLDNSTFSDDGYGDYTDLSTDLVSWQQYEISLSPGFEQFEFNEYFSVWIDLNHDGDFDDADEEVFDPGGPSLSTVNGTVTIPGDALPGPTRMRVVMRFNNEPSFCDENFNFGEVEDYCVSIIEGEEPDCKPPGSATVTEIGPTSAKLAWESEDAAIGYEVRLRPSTAATWTVISTSATQVATSNLEFCEMHEFQVRTVCIEEKSIWSPLTFFQTSCVSSASETNLGLTGVSIYPNPFSEDFRVSFSTEKSTTVNFELLNSTGQVAFETSQFFAPGSHLFLLSGKSESLPKGIYFLKIQTESGMSLRKLVKE